MSENSIPDVKANLEGVREQILDAARENRRKPDDITLVAVSKGHDQARIRPALEAGQQVFGENRVQEAAAKWPALRKEFPGVSLHLIGPLQTNKVRLALETFDVIESLDRPKLAHAIAKEAGPSGRLPRCYIQVNTGAEPQKAGVLPNEADKLIRLCIDEIGLPVEGLMCIPPVDEEPALHFALLREIASRHGLSGLSMGMSEDFRVAIALGATIVRIGTAIFGARETV